MKVWMCIMHVNFQFFLQIRDFDSLSLSIWSSAVTSRFMTFLMSYLGVILQVRDCDGSLHCRMVRLHTHILTYHAHIMYLPGWFPTAFPMIHSFKFYTCHAIFAVLPEVSVTRMWANAQPDGRPAEHRWRPLFNATKFG